MKLSTFTFAAAALFSLSAFAIEAPAAAPAPSAAITSAAPAAGTPTTWTAENIEKFCHAKQKDAKKFEKCVNSHKKMTGKAMNAKQVAIMNGEAKK